MMRETTEEKQIAMIMYDAILVDQIPSDAQAIAGYLDGSWPTFSSLTAEFPHAILFSITVTGDTSAHAMAVDDEPGDASTAAAVAWLKAQAARGTWRPCVYASVSSMGGVLSAMAAAGLNPANFRLWSAHYGIGSHICGPATCKLVGRTMDGTQWTDSALGRELDESLLADGFFPWYTELMTEIPTVQTGSTGQIVKNWQGLLVAHGYNLGTTGPRSDGIDGTFGAETENATKDFQSDKGLSMDGVVGSDTWTAALTS
jgi:hypothetical protein